jgi:hypothetical protein
LGHGENTQEKKVSLGFCFEFFYCTATLIFYRPYAFNPGEELFNGEFARFFKAKE